MNIKDHFIHPHDQLAASYALGRLPDRAIPELMGLLLTDDVFIERLRAVERELEQFAKNGTLDPAEQQKLWSHLYRPGRAMRGC